MARWKRFRAGKGDTLTVSLAEEELGILRALPEQLREVFDDAEDDPARARLFPRAYLDPTAETEEAEWQSLVGPSLLRERLDALELRASNWSVAPLRIDHVESSYFDDPQRFPAGTIAPDHALLMRDVRHTWHAHEPLLLR